MFGGWTDKNFYDKQIGKLDAYSVWSKVGDLIEGRQAHNVIFDGMYALVVGGPDNQYLHTEKCSLTSDGISCASQRTFLYNYAYYPELFMIPTDFCKSLP